MAKATQQELFRGAHGEEEIEVLEEGVTFIDY